MRKLFLAVLVVAMAFTVTATADEYVKGGFEAAGHVNTGFGWDYWNKNAVVPTPAVVGTPDTLTMGELAGDTAGPKDHEFMFFLEGAELDLMKTFGENIAARVDLDFGSNAAGSITNGIALEQAYTTANIAVGNGVEMMVGMFHLPIGFEAVDVNDNDLFTHSTIYEVLRPTTATGLKFYYAFTDAVDFHLYAVNDLANAGVGDDNDMPSAGFRLGYNWGDEGMESTLGLSGAFGPENTQRKKYTFLGDLDFHVWLTEAFSVGGEGLYRQDNDPAGATNAKYYGGLLNVNYDFSDVWDGTFKFAWSYQAEANNAATYGNLLGAKGSIYELSLGGGYMLADDAKFVLEAKVDYQKPDVGDAPLGFGGVAGFLYNF
ncbi:porin [bacterium]|nr:porin [bacterium]